MLLKPRKKNHNKKVRIYVDGVFDLFHHGHCNAIRQAKNTFEDTEVIVGINSDEDTTYHKGKPVQSQEERKVQVQNCKNVDQVICPAPWYPSIEFMQKNKIDFVAHDEISMSSDHLDDIYCEAKISGKFIRTFRSPEISTSFLIQRVIRDREEYIRSLKNKGYTLSQMRVSIPYFIGIKIKYWINGIFKKISSLCSRRKKKLLLQKRKELYERNCLYNGIIYSCNDFNQDNSKKNN